MKWSWDGKSALSSWHVTTKGAEIPVCRWILIQNLNFTNSMQVGVLCLYKFLNLIFISQKLCVVLLSHEYQLGYGSAPRTVWS